MVVSYTVEGNSFDADKPRLWSDGHVTLRDGSGRSLDLHPDSDRFAVASEAQNGPEQKTLVFVFNGFDELRRLASATTHEWV